MTAVLSSNIARFSLTLLAFCFTVLLTMSVAPAAQTQPSVIPVRQGSSDLNQREI